MRTVVILAPLALAACGGPKVSVENASADEVAATMDAAGGGDLKLSPGHYESTVSIDKIEIPGMPPQVAQRMQAAAAGKSTGSCLTPEEANRPAAAFFGGRDRKNCRYEHFSMGRGALDATMTCQAAGGAITVTMKGTYDATSFHTNMVTQANQGSANQMTMAATVDSRRTGDCTGKEDR